MRAADHRTFRDGLAPSHLVSPSHPVKVDQMIEPAQNADQRRPRTLRWIMLALVAWGIWLAVGAYWYRFDSGDQDPVEAVRAVRRGLLVLGCTGAFLLFWIVALALRARRGGHHR